MDTNLQSIQTNDLIQRAKRNRIESAIEGSAIYALILATSLSLTAILASDLNANLKGCLIVVAFTGVPVLSVWAVLSAAAFRTRRVVHELNRRFGRLSIRFYVAYYRDNISTGTTICIFRGHSLPHGGSHFGRVLIDSSGRATLQRSFGRNRYHETGPFGWEGVEWEERELPKDDAFELSSLIERTRGTGNSSFPNTVRDGFPASVAAIFGDGSTVTAVSANICGAAAAQVHDDRMKLLTLVASMACEWAALRKHIAEPPVESSGG